MAGMVCTGTLAVRHKRTVAGRELSSRFYCRTVPLPLFAVLAGAGDANLWFSSVGSLDRYNDSFFCGAGTFRGDIFDDHQPFRHHTMALLYAYTAGLDSGGVHPWNHIYRFSLGVNGVFPV